MRLPRAVALPLLLSLVGCRAAAAPRVLVLDDAVKMAADGRLLVAEPLDGYLAANPAWDGRAITLAGARGETVAFQVMVQAGAHPLRGVDVGVTDLVRVGGARIGAERLARFREWTVEVNRPSESPAGSVGRGEYPDALVPAEAPRLGLPVDVAAGRTQGVWIDCAIPRASPPGTYRGAVTVTADGATLARLDVSLEVRPFELPARRHLRWRIGYSGWEEVPKQLGLEEGGAEWLALERDLIRLAWEGHGVVPTTHYHRIPLAARGTGAALEIDWTDFDRRFGAYLDGSAFADGVPLPIFSLPINLHAGWPGRLPDDPALVDAPLLTAAARLVGRHWDEKGWRVEDTFVYVADEPDPPRHASIAKACRALHAGDPRIRTSVAFYQQFGTRGRALAEEFGGLVTMWDVAGDYLDPEVLRGRQAAGETVGFYQGGEPYQGGEAVDHDGLALTTWPWIAWRYRLDTLFLYNMTEWTYFRLDRVKVPWGSGKREIWENPLNQSWVTNSQGVLVYPGPYAGVRGVVPSMRLKQARRGMQDYEYLWLARQAGNGALADAVARRLVPRALREAGPPGEMGPRGAWVRDPRAWHAARRELAAAIPVSSPR